MDDATRHLMTDVLRAQPVAALATLHKGEPAVSMTPCAWMADGVAVIHVSRLATHTADLLAHPQVALLVTAPAAMADTPLALPRVSLQAQATPCLPDDPRYVEARQAYLSRLPDAEPMFGFGDFTLVRLVPDHVRFVGGFGRAHAVAPADWLAVCAGLSRPAGSPTGSA